MKFVVVCGYGCLLTERMRGYLEEVVQYLRTEPAAIVIVTGGFSNLKSMPCISEAWVMDSYLKSRGITNRVIHDDHAVTTLENIRNAANIIFSIHWRNDEDPQAEIVIFCDETRRVKVCYLARCIFHREIPIPTRFEVRGYDFKRGIREKLYQYLVGTPLEIFAYHVRPVEKKMRAWRLAMNAVR